LLRGVLRIAQPEKVLLLAEGLCHYAALLLKKIGVFASVFESVEQKVNKLIFLVKVALVRERTILVAIGLLAEFGGLETLLFAANFVI
jgi:hypothetical protein